MLLNVHLRIYSYTAVLLCRAQESYAGSGSDMDLSCWNDSLAASLELPALRPAQLLAAASAARVSLDANANSPHISSALNYSAVLHCTDLI